MAKRDRDLFIATIVSATSLPAAEAVDLARLLMRTQVAKRRLREWMFEGAFHENEEALRKESARVQKLKERAHEACKAAGLELTEDLNVLQVVVDEAPEGAWRARSVPVP